MNDFLQRLRERKLVQWALAYAAAAFALLQGLDIVAQQFGWADGVRRGITIALIIGFFVTLVLAWYHGERGAQRVSGSELLILTLLLVIGGAVLWRVAPSTNAPERHSSATTPSAPASSSTAGIADDQNAGASVPVSTKSIAVLPFDNLSRDPDNAYFAEGMQDEILTRLAGIADLKVISRTSTEKYKSHPDNLKTVAGELGVANILEGSVQKAGDAVRINVQLIDARNDAHLWAQTYDRELKNVFVVESEVSQQIADVLKARLSPREASALARAATQNAAAYDVFLKAEYHAKQAQDSWQEAGFEAAATEYRKAIALDPEFALAYAQLGYYQMVRHWFVRPWSTEELAQVKAAIDRAVALGPNLPEAHLALAYYHYWSHRDYDAAIEQFQQVRQLAPSNAGAFVGLAAIHRRKGEWSQALTAFESALPISPRDNVLNGEYGITFVVLRRYAEGEQQLLRALAMAPADANAKDFLMLARLFGSGNADGARAAFDPPPDWRISSQNIYGGDIIHVVNQRVYPDLFDRHFEKALRDWDSAPAATEEEKLTQRVARVAIKIIANDKAGLQPECGQLKLLLDDEVRRKPQSLGALQHLSWVDVCLGLNADAIRAARRGVELLPISKDAYFGVYQVDGLAEIDAHAGAPDEALALIEQLLALPAGQSMSVERLRRDPVWDPLRKDPRFNALLEAHAAGASDAKHE